MTCLWSYPGGKTRIAERIVEALPPRPSTYHEPFVGSGAVAIAIATRYPTTQIKVNDMDRRVISVWKCLADSKKAQELAARIRAEHKPTLTSFREMKDAKPRKTVDLAFQSVFLSKTSFSGLCRNPIGGQKQDKYQVSHKWRPERIVTELERLTALFEGRLSVKSEDAVKYLKQIENSDVAYFDPPYYKAGQVCYRVWMVPQQHDELSQQLKHLHATWLLSYDNNVEIRDLYSSWSTIRDIEMVYRMASHKSSCKPQNEILIANYNLNALDG